MHLAHVGVRQTAELQVDDDERHRAIPRSEFLNSAFLPYIVYSDPSYSTDTYDVDSDLRTVVNIIEGDFDFSANTVPLARYLRSGKKLIVWHGAEDGLMSHLDTVRSYEGMADAAGRHVANARLYTPPGVQHCGGGPGADAFDLVGALAKWVERTSAAHGRERAVHAPTL